MVESANLNVIRIKRILATIAVIIVNIILFNRIHNVVYSILAYNILLILSVLINVFYALYVTILVKPESKISNNKHMIDKLIDDMPFAIPLKQEYITNQDTHPSDIDESSQIDAEIQNDESSLQLESIKEKVDDGEKIIHEEETRIVENASFAIPMPKNIVTTTPIDDWEFDPTSYSNHLSTYLLDFGMSIDKNDTRELFAAMAASKLISINSESVDLTEKFVERFAEFIGASFFTHEMNSSIKTIHELMKESIPFKECLDHAIKTQDAIHMMVLKNIEYSVFESFGAPIISYAFNPLVSNEIIMDNESEVLSIPPNFWLFLIPKEVEGNKPSENLIKAIFSLETKTNLVDPKETVYLNDKKLTYSFLMDTLHEGYLSTYFNEEDWKKIDQLEKYLKSKMTYEIDNRLFRQLERYSSTFLLFGGETKEAMDRILFAKLIRMIDLGEQNKNNEMIEDMLLVFEKLFGLEYLNKSKVLLKSIQESQQ